MRLVGHDGVVVSVRSAWVRAAGTGPLGTFALAHVISGAGDAFVAVSLAGSLFFNLSPNASRNEVLLYLAITMVPFAVLAPLVGPAIDRYHGAHRSLASVTYLLRAVAAVGLAFTLFDLTFYPLALVLLIASKASGVVRQALVPRFVEHAADLVAANSLPCPPGRNRRRGSRRRRDCHDLCDRWSRPSRDGVAAVPPRRDRGVATSGRVAAVHGDRPSRVRGVAQPEHRDCVRGAHGAPRRRRLLRIHVGVCLAASERTGLGVRTGRLQLRDRRVHRQCGRAHRAETDERRDADGCRTRRRGRHVHRWRARRDPRQSHGIGDGPRPFGVRRASGL